MSTRRRIIIDTDPGQDDAIAILLALAAPDEIDVIAITAVAGNVPLDLTTVNACKVLELARRPDIPVFAGCDRPLKRALRTATHVHGKSGLDGIALPAPSMPVQPRHAVDFLVEILRREPEGTITLVAIGPLTNVAAALVRAPEIAPRIAEIVVMGGAYFEVGNVTPTAEFNSFVDPEAAKIVYGCGAPITTMPLDVTHKALVTEARLAPFRAMGTPIGDAVAGWTGFFERFDKAKYGGQGAPLHDPCTIAYLLRPEFFTGRHVNVEIETESALCRGMSVADWWGVTDRVPNATFMGDLDADGFFRLLADRLATLGRDV